MMPSTSPNTVKAPPMVIETCEPALVPAHDSMVVVIAASTGGPAAIMRTLGAFPEQAACSILIAQHMPAGFTTDFAERLNRSTSFAVKEAKGGEVPTPSVPLVRQPHCYGEAVCLAVSSAAKQ